MRRATMSKAARRLQGASPSQYVYARVTQKSGREIKRPNFEQRRIRVSGKTADSTGVIEGLS